MGRAKSAARHTSSPAPDSLTEIAAEDKRRGHAGHGKGPATGLRERKKARLRQQIVETALHLFRQRGYENTRIDDIVQTSGDQPAHFLSLFPQQRRSFA